MANILVAEDELLMLALLAEILEGATHHVLTARNGVEALSIARSHDLDLVITDIGMPREDGLGLIRALRKARPEVKIIAISGGDRETLQDAKLLGAHAALEKPVAARAVLQCICELLTPART